MTSQQNQSARRWFPAVFDFSCFRNFLNSYAQAMKEKDPQFNYSVWARELGLKATTSITMVLHGQRTCGPQIRQKLEIYFGFDALEKKYFDCLVRLDRFEDDSTMKQLVLEELKRIYPKAGKNLLSVSDHSSLEAWFQESLQRLSSIRAFSDDEISEIFHWLQTRLADPSVRVALGTAN